MRDEKGRSEKTMDKRKKMKERMTRMKERKYKKEEV